MADYLTTDTELTSVANAIRAKGGTSASLTYPNGFVSAIQAIPTGGGGTVNTCTMTIDADGVTCSDFSDHTPTGAYAVVATTGGDYPWFLFYATLPDPNDPSCMFGVSDTSAPGWWGLLSDPYNSVTLLDGSVEEFSEPGFSPYAGIYTGTVIEP